MGIDSHIAHPTLSDSYTKDIVWPVNGSQDRRTSPRGNPTVRGSKFERGQCPDYCKVQRLLFGAELRRECVLTYAGLGSFPVARKCQSIQIRG